MIRKILQDFNARSKIHHTICERLKLARSVLDPVFRPLLRWPSLYNPRFGPKHSDMQDAEICFGILR
jgi:hypothetical protein